MTGSLRVCASIAKNTFVESRRRKDFLVLFILTALIVGCAGAFARFGASGLGTFIKDIGFATIGILSTILTVVVSVRQVPEEFQRRTIYPIMARPITRLQFVLGKWAGAFLASVFGYLLMAAVCIAAMLILRVSFGPILAQYLLAKCLGFIWLSALALMLSIYITPSAAATIALILSFCSSMFDRMFLVAQASGPVATGAVRVLYGFLPHYDLFDLGAKVTYDWPTVPGWAIGFLLLYAVLGGGVWIGVAWLRFRRQAL